PSYRSDHFCEGIDELEGSPSSLWLVNGSLLAGKSLSTGPVTAPARTGGAMGVRIRPVAGAAGLVLAVGVLAVPASARAVHQAGTAPATPTTVVGTGYAAPARSVTVSGANARAGARGRTPAQATVPPLPLGRDGKPAGSALPARTGSGARPSLGTLPHRAG